MTHFFFCVLVICALTSVKQGAVICNAIRTREESMNDQRCSAVLPTTRLDTRLTQSRAGGQWPYLRSFDHLGRSSEAKIKRKTKK